MTTPRQQLADELLRRFAAALRSGQLYSKSHPIIARNLELLTAAIQQFHDHAPSVVIGDSVYDVEAAKNAGMPAIVVRSGGFGDDELREAGAVAIFDTPADLTAALDDTDLA